MVVGQCRVLLCCYLQCLCSVYSDRQLRDRYLADIYLLMYIYKYRLDLPRR